jgi:hypothetical protein
MFLIDACLENGLYKANCTPVSSAGNSDPNQTPIDAQACASSHSEDAYLIHRRFGHIGMSTLSKCLVLEQWPICHLLRYVKQHCLHHLFVVLVLRDCKNQSHFLVEQPKGQHHMLSCMLILLLIRFNLAIALGGSQWLLTMPPTLCRYSLIHTKVKQLPFFEPRLSSFRKQATAFAKFGLTVMRCFYQKL